MSDFCGHPPALLLLMKRCIDYTDESDLNCIHCQDETACICKTVIEIGNVFALKVTLCGKLICAFTTTWKTVFVRFTVMFTDVDEQNACVILINLTKVEFNLIQDWKWKPWPALFDCSGGTFILTLRSARFKLHNWRILLQTRFSSSCWIQSLLLKFCSLWHCEIASSAPSVGKNKVWHQMSGETKSSVRCWVAWALLFLQFQGLFLNVSLRLLHKFCLDRFFWIH